MMAGDTASQGLVQMLDLSESPNVPQILDTIHISYISPKAPDTKHSLKRSFNAKLSFIFSLKPRFQRTA